MTNAHPLYRRPGDENKAIWIDEWSNLPADQQRILACWTYRNVLNRSPTA